MGKSFYFGLQVVYNFFIFLFHQWFYSTDAGDAINFKKYINEISISLIYYYNLQFFIVPNLDNIIIIIIIIYYYKCS